MARQQGADGDRELYDTLFRCLQSPVRRRILFGLSEHNPNGGLIVPDDVHVGEKSAETLRIELVHQHVPVLEEAGLVRWDPDDERVQAGPRFPEVRALIEAINDTLPTVLDE